MTNEEKKLKNIEIGTSFAYKMEDGYYIFIVLEKCEDTYYRCEQLKTGDIFYFYDDVIRQGISDLITKR